MPRTKLIIDTDPAIGYALRDVDDALALLYLLARPDEFEVLGVTSVFGNASLRCTTARAVEVLEVAGRTEIPVMPGASSRRRLGIDSPASDFLSRSVDENPGEVTVLALGPLTNVATAGGGGRFYEDVARIVIMGGALEEGFGIPLFSPLEFNFFSDPPAADDVLGAPCEKVVLTADLCRQALFTRRELDALFRMGSRPAIYLAYRIRPWLRLNQIMPFLPWKGGFVPWDAIAAEYLRRPELFGEERKSGACLRRGKFATGAIIDDPGRDDRPATIPTRLDEDALMDEFLSAIAQF